MATARDLVLENVFGRPPGKLTRDLDFGFALSFAGVGLRTNFREMSKQGLRPFIVGAVGEILIACLTLGLVVGANRIWGL